MLSLLLPLGRGARDSGLRGCWRGARNCGPRCGSGGVDEDAFALRACLARGVIGTPALTLDAKGSYTLVDRRLPRLAGIQQPPQLIDQPAMGRGALLRLLFE
jgi:hypothetical protein